MLRRKLLKLSVVSRQQADSGRSRSRKTLKRRRVLSDPITGDSRERQRRREWATCCHSVRQVSPPGVRGLVYRSRHQELLGERPKTPLVARPHSRVLRLWPIHRALYPALEHALTDLRRLQSISIVKPDRALMRPSRKEKFAEACGWMAGSSPAMTS